MDKSLSRVQMIVVLFLGGIGSVLAVGILVLAFDGKTADAGLYGLAGTTIGGLGALLTNLRPHTAGTAADPISVSTPEGQPLEVTESTEVPK